MNAQWLLAAAIGINRNDMLSQLSVVVDDSAMRRFERYLRKKESGIPLSYILGWHCFRNIRLKVDERVLIPRPETEELAGYAADFINQKGGKISVLDFGTGSGAIALWLAYNFPDINVAAADKSRDALACARENAIALGVYNRIRFIETSSIYRIKEKFDLIVSNPPYIPSHVINGLSVEVQSEPKIALDGGFDGLEIAKMIVRQSPGRLNSKGRLLMELGREQAKTLIKNMSSDWARKKILKDFNGVESFLSASRK